MSKPSIKSIRKKNKPKHIKLKVISAIKKRFSLNAGGKLKVTQANKQHNMRKRSKRQLRETRGSVYKTDQANGTIKNIIKFANLSK